MTYAQLEYEQSATKTTKAVQLALDGTVKVAVEESGTTSVDRYSLLGAREDVALEPSSPTAGSGSLIRGSRRGSDYSFVLKGFAPAATGLPAPADATRRWQQGSRANDFLFGSGANLAAGSSRTVQEAARTAAADLIALTLDAHDALQRLVHETMPFVVDDAYLPRKASLIALGAWTAMKNMWTTPTIGGTAITDRLRYRAAIVAAQCPTDAKFGWQLAPLLSALANPTATTRYDPKLWLSATGGRTTYAGMVTWGAKDASLKLSDRSWVTAANKA